MVASLDVVVATTLADTVGRFKVITSGAANGLKFEQTLFQAVLNAHHWRYATPPDQYDLGLPIRTRTGTSYEHDGMFADDDTLYVIEAKWLRSPITRQTVGIFVQKLLDTLLGSYADIGHFALKPVIVSGNTVVDRAAWRHAAAFGILLITPDLLTPHELVGILQREQAPTPAVRRLTEESNLLADRLWRKFNSILLAPSSNTQTFPLAADQIYDANLTAQLLAQWSECARLAADLRLVPPALRA
jgi:hypothetical protein